MKPLLSLFALLVGSIHAQGQAGSYQASHAASLSGAADTVTIQNAATQGSPKQVRFSVATVYCSVACTATVYQNGAPATTTTLAPVGLNNSPPPLALAFSASNGGITGAASFAPIAVPAGGTVLIDLSKFTLSGNSNANLSVGIGSITGNSTVAIQWTEQ